MLHHRSLASLAILTMTAAYAQAPQPVRGEASDTEWLQAPAPRAAATPRMTTQEAAQETASPPNTSAMGAAAQSGDRPAATRTARAGRIRAQPADPLSQYRNGYLP